MDNLVIEKTKYTPEIRFLNNGNLRISGFSMVENPLEVYSRPLNWLKGLSTSSPMPIQLNLKFDFLDSSSVRSVADMVKILNNLPQKKFDKVSVNWFYENGDEDMRETGTDLSTLAKIEFNVVQTNIDDLEY